MGKTIAPGECVSPMDALKMYVYAPAYAAFEEKAKGTIASGKLADLVIIDKDPAKIEEGQFMEIKFVMTVIDGKVVWTSGSLIP